ncbi:MAG: CHRD domain-containing protein [Candidatus Eisenbacteria bacterium]|nr:CHRD domain-containing protein [Candidatus Eisenbacteria bacterium]
MKIRALTLSLLLCVGIVAAASAVTYYSSDLNGGNVVPPNNSGGIGYAFLSMNDTNDLLTFTLNYQGMDGQVTGAEIRRGGVGQNGDLVLRLSDQGFPNGYQGNLPWNANDVNDLNNGNLYIVFNTDQYPDGEIRGQIQSVAVPTNDTTWGEIRALYR